MGKIPDDFPGLFGLKINQHVATKDQIHRVRVVQERRIDVFNQIEMEEVHHLPDVRQNFPMFVAGLFEMALLEPGRRASERPLAENALGRLMQELGEKFRAMVRHLDARPMIARTWERTEANWHRLW